MADVGRPTVMDENVLRILEGAFADGATDELACFMANIAPSSLYSYQVENPEFTERKKYLKDQVKFQAKKNVRDAITNGDKEMSKWYLERRDNEFKPKSDLTSGDKPIPIYGGLSVQKHDGDPQDIQPDQENTGGSGGDISQ